MGRGDRELAVVLLAAGEGTRMKSRRAKVLHELAGRPMLAYPLGVASEVASERPVVVVGNDADQVRDRFGDRARWVVQAERRGTGHAVLQAQATLAGYRGPILLMYGDTPLLRRETVQRMLACFSEKQADLVLLSARLPLPGRVVRDATGAVARIVEVTDASPDERAIEEGNTGVYVVDSELLWEALPQVGDANEQSEIYVTDVVAYAVRQGRRVEALQCDDPLEGTGVNTRAELAQASEALRKRRAEELMDAGVTIVDPANTYIDADVTVGADSVIEPGCVISGETRIGERVHLKPHCVVESSQIDDDVVIGPSAHLRPGTRLRRGVRIGNFVEVKNSDLGEGVKADHLAYIGDADVGAGAHFGCGAIVVNYDGVEKFRTVVKEGAFVGCNVNLVAPVTIEKDAYVAAGSTITKDVPADSLAVARERQRHIDGWPTRHKSKKRAKKE